MQCVVQGNGRDAEVAFRAAFAQALEAGAAPLGISLTGAQVEACASHAWQVRQANAGVNLTRIVEPDAMAVRHTLDSLAPLGVWPDAVAHGPHTRAVDVGSGAGYPGLPLAMVRPDVEVVLLEATRKKAEHLIRFAAGQPNVSVVWGRAEHPVREIQGTNRVWVRAVGPLFVLVELAFGLLTPGGWLVAWKGPEVDGEEWELGVRVARRLGGRAVGLRAYKLGDGAERRLAVFERGEGALPPGIPRAPGLIRRRPLVERGSPGEKRTGGGEVRKRGRV